MLRMHPDIIAPPYDETEISFWGWEDMERRGLEYYKAKLKIDNYSYMKITVQSLMPLSMAHQKVVVKMPGLTLKTNNKTLVKMYSAMPDLKLLMIVRNPITRILSHIMHEYFNPGGLFEGQELPNIDDLILLKRK